VPRDGDADRFVGPDGLPPYDSSDTGTPGARTFYGCARTPRGCSSAHQTVDSHRRASTFHSSAARHTTKKPAAQATSTPVSRYAWLVREPDNPHDPNAVAVYDATGTHTRIIEVSRSFATCADYRG
jgi:hypothetical protein